MDRDDADQEGINLQNTTHDRMVARDEANRAILTHLRLCPFAVDKVNERLRVMEMSFSRLVGFMLGSGLLGGIAGSIVAKLMK